jgi:enoyl-CoA hydratase
MSLVEKERPEAGVVLLRLNRPERLNALIPSLVAEMHDHLDAAKTDRDCRVVILTGAGRGFCAGADLKADPEHEPNPFAPRPGVIGVFEMAEHYSDMIIKLRNLRKPVIAAVNGPATGGGLALVLGSDIRIGAESARFAVSFIKAGFSGCDMGTSWLLPRLVGASRAHELLLTGRLFDAREAERLGLLIEVVPDGQVVDAALAKAREILQNNPFGVALTKEVMWANLEVASLEAGVDLENRTQAMTTATDDSGEARRAFVERRPPRFEFR